MRRVYNFYYMILYPIMKIFFRLKSSGTEKIPDGAALVCANHSSILDPMLIAVAFTKKHFLHFMAKKELAKSKIMKLIIDKGGSFLVDRAHSDIEAIKTTIKYLKSDEKVMMFPEGTRISDEDSTAAKNGAVRIAVKTKAPIVPVYIQRKKKIFRKTYVVVGDPYYIEAPDKKDDSSEFYKKTTTDLMKRINLLQEKVS